ncbi:uncharacterized protein Dvar_21390 [Desulfosarcina variabilis str. Montpellier]
MFMTSGALAARHDIDANVGFFGGAVELDADSEEYGHDYDEDGDISGNRYKLGYTFYFNELLIAEVPNDLKVFLQHPARIYASFSGGTYEEDRDIEVGYHYGTGKKSWETSYQDFELGGSYYFPSNTGLGIAVALGSEEKEYDYSFSTDESNYYGYSDSYSYDADGDRRKFKLWVDQYLEGKHRLRFSYSNFLKERSYKNSNGFSWENDYTTNWYLLNYKAAYGGGARFVLDLTFGYGQEEYEYSTDTDEWTAYNFGLNFGPAFSRFAIYFYFDFTTWDPDQAELYDRYNLVFGINPRFWFGDHVSMDINLFGELDEYDYPDNSSSYDQTDGSFNIDIALKIRF